MDTPTTDTLIRRGCERGIVIPAFNIPYLPMMAPVVAALRDTGSFGLIMVARLEWEKFGAGSTKAVRDEYERVKDARHTRLHLDHVPVIDEDSLAVDYERIIAGALDQGYESVMVDGSRLPLSENIAATRRIVERARAYGAAVESELGAVLGHEAGPLPPYEELFASGRGFTDPAEAARFVAGSGTSWLSVAVGNIHGAISAAAREAKKVEARLDLAHLRRLREAAGIPLVLHGGTGIRRACLREAFGAGIAKINVATHLRQPYELALKTAPDTAERAVYRSTVQVLEEELGVAGRAQELMEKEQT